MSIEKPNLDVHENIPTSDQMDNYNGSHHDWQTLTNVILCQKLRYIQLAVYTKLTKTIRIHCTYL